MIYEVKQGESLYVVAKKFGTTADKLKELNNLTVMDAVLPGMRLKIDK
jgi:LysM repeat protein